MNPDYHMLPYNISSVLTAEAVLHVKSKLDFRLLQDLQASHGPVSRTCAINCTLQILCGNPSWGTGASGDLADIDSPAGRPVRWRPPRGLLTYHHLPGHSPGLVSVWPCIALTNIRNYGGTAMQFWDTLHQLSTNLHSACQLSSSLLERQFMRRLATSTGPPRPCLLEIALTTWPPANQLQCNCSLQCQVCSPSA